jgi:hypothetical protein
MAHKTEMHRKLKTGEFRCSIQYCFQIYNCNIIYTIREIYLQNLFIPLMWPQDSTEYSLEISALSHLSYDDNVIFLHGQSEFCQLASLSGSHGSPVGIVLGYRLDNWGSRVRFPVGAGNFSLHHCIQNGCGAHPVSNPIGTRGSFPGSKAAGVWSWPLTSI